MNLNLFQSFNEFLFFRKKKIRLLKKKSSKKFKVTSDLSQSAPSPVPRPTSVRDSGINSL